MCSATVWQLIRSCMNVLEDMSTWLEEHDLVSKVYRVHGFA